MTLKDYYNSKGNTYFNSARIEALKLVRNKNNRILDLGCGTGHTGKELKKLGLAKEVIGVELFEDAAKEAKSNLDRIIVGNIEEIELPFEKNSFDYILAMDILEHLYDPWRIISTTKKFLKKDGTLIVSIPNVQNWRLLRDLVFKGEWKYVDQGLLDKTHIRFFTRKSLLRLFSGAGFTSIEIIPGFRLHPKGYKATIINILTLGLFRNFLVHQYVIKCKL